MKELEGIVIIQRDIGSDVLVINNIPVSQYYRGYNGKEIILTIVCAKGKTYEFEGTADIFYFEGKQHYYRGTKYVDDFFIDDIDIRELLEQHENESVKIIISS
ncbi:hypothetical protein SFC57_19715 [Niallia circulans]|uniref:hypothetical protein n=1 Tax=Niallia circulans TaxID=1397 RepID=UPI0015609059|nr:hypothetical protein [Niallia circulans]NRG32887.1 hypothetical protein [Niallia circulans]